MVVGVLGLQGDFAKHIDILNSLGETGVAVRKRQDLADISGLIIPGGESTTLSLLLDSQGLYDDIKLLLSDRQMPVFGTCAGMVMLAKTLIDAKEGQKTFGAVDISVKRNAFGSQIFSFEKDLIVEGIDSGVMHAVFIRAPYVVRVGSSVSVLADIEHLGERHPVVCQEGRVLVSAFHPEIVGDDRLHRLWLEKCVH
jgi:5'-phosphate synthase pdxT subunit